MEVSYFMFCGCLVLVHMLNNGVQGKLAYEDEVNGLRFERVGLLVKTPRPSDVLCMELDRFVSNSVLYSTRRQLLTVNLNGTEHENSVIAGNSSVVGYNEDVGPAAEFDTLSGFTQLNDSLVVAVDSSNYCLRYVNRETNTTSQAIGHCGSSDNEVNGDFKSTRFNSKPLSLIRRTNNTLLLIQSSQQIKQIDLAEGHVTDSLRIPSSFGNPTSLTFASDSSTDIAFITTDFQILKADLITGMVVALTRGDTGGRLDGTLPAPLFNRLTGIVMLNRHTFAVVDKENGVVRVADLHANKTSSICVPGVHINEIDGNIRSCRMFLPISVLYLRDRNEILVGTSFAIRIISVSQLTPPDYEEQRHITVIVSDSSSEVISSNASITTPLAVISDDIPSQDDTLILSVAVVGAISVILIAVITWRCRDKIFARWKLAWRQLRSNETDTDGMKFSKRSAPPTPYRVITEELLNTYDVINEDEVIGKNAESSYKHNMTILDDDYARIEDVVEVNAENNTHDEEKGSVGEGSAGEGSAGEGSTGEGSAGEGSAGEGSAGEGSAGEGHARGVIVTGPQNEAAIGIYWIENPED